MKRLTIKAPAKVNLFLDILGKRKDGYHDVLSLLAPVSLYDTVILEKTPRQIKTVTDEHVRYQGIPWPFSMGRPEANLTNRAAHLLRRATGYAGGARIILKKRIPIAAGLGGGSSNAAAVLKGLNRLWKTGWSCRELMNLGAELGCDIPSMVHGGAVVVNGRGEKIMPAATKPRWTLWMVLVNPGFGISTTDAYARYDASLKRRANGARFARVCSGLKAGSLARVAGGLFNALEQTVLQKYPLLSLLKNELEKAGAKGVGLSGSGATLFGLVKNQKDGRKVEAGLRRAAGCPVWTRVVKIIGG